MFAFTPLLVLAAIGLANASPHTSSSAAPTSTGAACTSYTIIDTRGTGEAQGESRGFTTMNQRIMQQVTGGSRYDTVYPAGYNQDSSQATTDIVNHVNANTNTCYILEGYSQGAAATVNAMSKLTGAAFNAVRGVILIGDPLHKAGLACNVDNNGGDTTKNVNGISAAGSAGIPSNWVSKTLDICIKTHLLTVLDLCNQGDGVCDTTDGSGITSQHLQYPNDSPTQTLGANFAISKLK
ncbi:A cutinase-like protein from cryptococcus Sp [Acaromyces ingoldii]|uniref:A cutinase-like protein from cryptococcus Sp n=1 Tax=Acaromyces ingoldii TaxID=215250 RepID=A0A316YBT2_9BASI|nr:A cutinase-like protein from cryptococcus Sp [Acaromyces ingoldii]PWN87230.1 A cutinase-like protein from cryptococcus Sp [Acaromyces ingoldii]